jgi:hypothetical protein
MASPRVAHVYEATLSLEQGIDPAAPGGAVTAKLCGHVAHTGPCRWPHNNTIDTTSTPARFRTIYVCQEQEQDGVARRIESALRAATGWTVDSCGQASVNDDERELVARLLETPPPMSH